MTDTEIAQSFDPKEAAELCGLSDQQFRLAEALRMGANATQAAKKAGYKGDSTSLRSSASRASRSPKVLAYLSMAEKHGAGVAEHPGDADELKRLLWRHARGTDRAHSIRSLEVINRIEQAEMAARQAEMEPIEVLALIAEIDPLYAVRLADHYDLKFTPKDWPNVCRCESCGQPIPDKQPVVGPVDGQAEPVPETNGSARNRWGGEAITTELVE